MWSESNNISFVDMNRKKDIDMGNFMLIIVGIGIPIISLPSLLLMKVKID